ncbi:thiamine pyrophosphate-dependent dehydrogenase E1 component subunit alpha [Microbispora hainanensis]|uniref:Thiamine pyrophosphate-dependent dehydrogenase E1 component subunit alpha n=1 Tax=Microbispora hainanensis TaxID=568844 RepID=A0A544YMP1_9ACTN|nr:thiamine pyrophosphate-dependent dehydrogenase E1 component subunit alpha [Microbispora hainanensis]TQS17966.1 thiamine pyrophosphate-dependent dehydrogenase E1 component subunit alpha [Microbispora hainanensis]
MTQPVTAVSPAGTPDDADLSLMLTIRAFELKLLDLYGKGLLNGTTHTCLGQEYIPVAIEGLLDPRDHVFSNHRGHGHYLARFRDPAGLLAEIMGREGAVCAGVGGSQHIRRDRFLSTGVQGESLPVAAGVALHLKRAEPGRLACVYVGDGTFGEGAVYEALNIASLWALPLLVVVENNGIAQSTPTARHLAGSIAGRAAAFGIDHHLIGTSDVAEIRRTLEPLVARVRSRSTPLVVEFVTRRLGPHSKGDDTRPAGAVQALREQDWYAWCAAACPGRFPRLDAEARAHIDAVAAEVTARGPSRWVQS